MEGAGRAGTRIALALVLLSASALGCYETQELRVHLVTPPSTVRCVETIDRVATEAGYARAPITHGRRPIDLVRAEDGAHDVQLHGPRLGNRCLAARARGARGRRSLHL